MMVKTDTFLENLELHQSVRTFVIQNGLHAEKESLLAHFLYGFAEAGLASRVFHRIRPNYTPLKLEKVGGKDGFVHYEGLQEYIEANTRISALQFNQLDYLFRVYLTIVTAILVLHLVHFVAMIGNHQIQNWLLRWVSFS